jgi:hypothetical protein
VAYALVSCQVLIGAVFAVAALSKLRSAAARQAFAASVKALRLVPPAAVPRVAAAVAVTEASVAGLTLLPRAGFALAGVMLLGFCAVIVRARRFRVECRCFGASSAPLGPVHLVRNGLLIAVAALGWAVASAGHAGLAPGGLAVAALAGAAGAALLIVVSGNLRSV